MSTRGAVAQADVDDGRRLALRHVPLIFMYHNVDEVSDDPDQLCVTPQRFAEQMSWLERRGLRGVGIAELVEAMRLGRHRRLVGLTFDDGYEAVAHNALPELTRRKFSASVYLVTSQLSGTNVWDPGLGWPLLSADSIEQLVAAGIEVGSHTTTHKPLAGATAAELVAEVTDSRAVVAELTGTEVAGFAYPYGSMDDAARAAVRAAGYRYACAVHTPPSHFGPLALPRVYVGQADAGARMDAKRLLYRPYVTIKGRSS